MTLTDVEAVTKIRQRFLRAIENDQPEEFSAPVYGRGCVRTYAASIGLDPSEMVALFDRLLPIEVVGVQRETKPLRRPGPAIGRALLVFGVLFALSVGGYYLLRQYSLFLSSRPLAADASAITPAPSDASYSALPLPAAPAPAPTVTSSPTSVASPTSTPVKGVHLLVRVKERAWLRVVVDDQIKYEGIPQIGSELAFDGNDKILLRTGNAGGTEVTFNGKLEGTLGAPGEVKDVQWTARS